MILPLQLAIPNTKTGIFRRISVNMIAQFLVQHYVRIDCETLRLILDLYFDNIYSCLNNF